MRHYQDDDDDDVDGDNNRHGQELNEQYARSETFIYILLPPAALIFGLYRVVNVWVDVAHLGGTRVLPN